MAVCRWPGQQVPVVRFVSGREALMLPEVFEADVHSSGKCRRIQVHTGCAAKERQIRLTLILVHL